MRLFALWMAVGLSGCLLGWKRPGDSGLDSASETDFPQDTYVPPPTCDLQAAAVVGNQIPDPGFDQGLLCWNAFQAGERDRGFQVDEDHPTSGQAPSLRGENDVVTGDTFRTQVLTGGLVLEDGKSYELSFYARAGEDRVIQVLLYDTQGSHSHLHQDEAIGTAWARHSFVVDVNYTTQNANFEIQMGQALAPVWLDDVVLAER